MFLQPKYTPHTMRHTCATQMLEAGVPLMAIKNFLGHASVATTERYAELSQSTIDKHIREWNRRWFLDADPARSPKRQSSPTDFLKEFALKIIREVFAESLDFTGFALCFSDYFSSGIMRPCFAAGFSTPR